MAQQEESNTDWQDLPPIESTAEEQDECTPSAKKDQTFSFIRDHIDLHSTMYRQHLVATNRSIPCAQSKHHADLKLSKLSESSSSKSKVKPISGTGTITVVTKTTTTTTITGFPVVGVATQQSDAMAHQHVAQKVSFSNISSDDDDDDDNKEYGDEMSVSESDFDDVSSLQDYASSNSSTFSDQSHQQEQETNEPSSSRITKQGTPITTTKSRSSRRKSSILKNKRTTTSYDAKTTAYLKKAFFNYYSKQCKLTKEQRELVIDETGLRSRNITYWFSNHKRRLGTELQMYAKVAKEHGIQNYDEFMQWRHDHGLPTHITREEIKQFKANASS